jgi:cytochrome c5
MKKYYLLAGICVLLITCTSWVLMGRKSSVSPDANQAIPEDVKAVFNASCIPCHGTGGKKMATSIVDLSNWDKYSPDTQAKKAAKICNAATKGFMPPKAFREANPNAIPTTEQRELICKWSQTLAAPNSNK